MAVDCCDINLYLEQTTMFASSWYLLLRIFHVFFNSFCNSAFLCFCQRCCGHGRLVWKINCRPCQGQSIDPSNWSMGIKVAGYGRAERHISHHSSHCKCKSKILKLGLECNNSVLSDVCVWSLWQQAHLVDVWWLGTWQGDSLLSSSRVRQRHFNFNLSNVSRGQERSWRRNRTSSSTLLCLCFHAFIVADYRWMLPVVFISFFLYLIWTLAPKTKKKPTIYYWICVSMP